MTIDNMYKEGVNVVSRLLGPDDVSRFDAQVTSDTKESGKTVKAEYRFPGSKFVEDSDSGEGCDVDADVDDASYVHDFNYIDPRFMASAPASASASASAGRIIETKVVDNDIATDAKNRN